MHRRSRFAAVATSALFALGVISHIAFAAPKDNAAKKLDKEAMESDFLNANFEAAEKKLHDAVKQCGDSGCTPKIKAQVLVHLGIIQVNLTKADQGKKSFVEALKIDSSVAPEGDFTTPEIEKAFNEAKKEASGSGSATTAPTATDTGSSGGDNELTHSPVAEQMVNTPVPIFVGVPDGLKVAKVIVQYKPFGSPDWKKLELKKVGDGYGGLIPCEELGTTGDLKYYIKAIDDGGDSVAEVGKASKPLITKIKNQLDGDPPHLPKQPPPAQCIDRAACPPGFPCDTKKKKHGSKGWGSACEKSEECAEGLFCGKESTCEEGTDPSEGGGDEPATGPFKKNWMGLVLSPDLALISGDDVCGRDSQKNKGYSCFRSDGVQYHGDPLPGAGNAISTGLSPSTVRVMAVYDRVFGKNITGGLRFGFAFNGGPKPDGGNAFLPVHLEVRLAYWFGQSPFSTKGFRPFVFLGGGLAQVDTKVDVSVRERESDACPYEQEWCDVVDENNNILQTNPRTQTVSAWHKAGQSFIGFGGGVMYAISPRSGPVFDIKISQMFPTSGTIISPELGYMFGF